MIVVDASAFLEVLLATNIAPRVSDRIFRQGQTIHVPELLDLEIAQVLRRFCLNGKMEDPRAAEALGILAGLPLVRHGHGPFIPRIWQLRHSLTAYDAVYVALAETLECPLITRDLHLASSHGHRALIETLD